MLSIIGGSRHGVIPQNPESQDGLRLKIVKVDPTVSSFLSGIGAIITELELRTARNERVGTYTVIGTALSLPESHAPNRRGTTVQFTNSSNQSVVVVSAGAIAENAPDNFWPAKLAQYPGTPILVASGALYFRGPLLRPPARSFLTLYGPSLGTCRHIYRNIRITGISPAVAIITALAADMLTRPKVRAKLFIDNAALPPGEQSPETFRPVSAKIRNYLDSLAFDHGGHGFRAVWNGLDPDVTDINEYRA